MPFPVLVPAAEADIDEALQNTLAKGGEQKFEQYIGLIEKSGQVSSACVSWYDLADGKLLECSVDTLKSIRFDEQPQRADAVTPLVFQLPPNK